MIVIFTYSMVFTNCTYTKWKIWLQKRLAGPEQEGSNCSNMANWGYTKKDGPHTWTEVAPAAKGKRQSPVDIKPAQAAYDANLNAKKLTFSYTPVNTKSIQNNGKTAVVDIAGSGSTLKGGPVDHVYEGVQFHWHWGKKTGQGSEHTVDGKMYDAELHIVHYNTELFKDFPSAASQDKGLCVLGAFLKAGKEHKGYNDLLSCFSKMRNAGQTVPIGSGFDPACLLPENKSDYYTYLGSLTTPPCFESVTWVVFKEPVEVSEAQLEAFRSLQSTKPGEAAPTHELGAQMVENYRPPLDLGDRKLRKSFQ